MADVDCGQTLAALVALVQEQLGDNTLTARMGVGDCRLIPCGRTATGYTWAQILWGGDGWYVSHDRQTICPSGGPLTGQPGDLVVMVCDMTENNASD